jgi:hypothetical protein
MRLFLQAVKSCAILDTSTSSCSSLTVLPFSFRMSWDRPASVGYDTYFPSNTYGIDYYHVEVSANPSDFQNLVVSITCQIGQRDSVCNFDRRVAGVVGLTKARVYYYRVMVGTIIGDGQSSTTVTSPTITGSPGAPIAVSLSLTEVSVGVLRYIYKFQAPKDTGDGTSVLPIFYHIEVSATISFSTVVESATLDTSYSNYLEGLKGVMTWSPQASGWGTLSTRYSFRVRAANFFDENWPSGKFSDTLSRKLCTSNSTSEEGSDAIADCKCIASFLDKTSFLSPTQSLTIVLIMKTGLMCLQNSIPMRWGIRFLATVIPPEQIVSVHKRSS